MSLDGGGSYVAWPKNTPVPWAQDAREPPEPDWSPDGSGAHPAAEDAGSGAHSAAEEHGSGAHPGTEQNEEPPGRTREMPAVQKPWILTEKNEQPPKDSIAVTHTRKLPLPAAATFTFDDGNGEQTMDLTYGGHGVSKMVYAFGENRGSSLCAGRVLKLTPEHDPEAATFQKLPLTLVTQVHAVNSVVISTPRFAWKQDRTTWHAWISDYAKPVDIALNHREVPLVAVVMHLAPWTYVNTSLYEGIVQTYQACM